MELTIALSEYSNVFFRTSRLLYVAQNKIEKLRSKRPNGKNQFLFFFRDLPPVRTAAFLRWGTSMLMMLSIAFPPKCKKPEKSGTSQCCAFIMLTIIKKNGMPPRKKSGVAFSKPIFLSRSAADSRNLLFASSTSISAGALVLPVATKRNCSLAFSV